MPIWEEYENIKLLLKLRILISFSLYEQLQFILYSLSFPLFLKHLSFPNEQGQHAQMDNNLLCML